MRAFDPFRPRYRFNASAVPFAANLTKPVPAEIDPIASTTISPEGGSVFARVDGFNYREILSVASATSQISGTSHKEESEFDTVINCSLEGVNILGIFTIDRVVTNMTVKRSVVLNSTQTGWVPTANLFDYTGSYISGFRVCGEPVTFTLSSDVQRESLKSLKQDQALAVTKGVESLKGADSKKVKSLLDEAMGTRILKQSVDLRHILGKLCRVVEMNEPVYKTLVTKSEGGGEFRTDRPNEFRVPGFGRIVFCDVIQNPGHQTLSMFRFELGCGNEGGGSGGNGGGNGDPIFPP